MQSFGMDLGPLVEYLKTIGINLDSEATAAFDAFGEDLYKVNQEMNLTRVAYEDCTTRHFVDSILVQEFVPPDATVLDIGTGPGFPSWPLAVVRRDIHIIAVDSSAKMLGFLKRHPLPNLRILLGRAEENVGRESVDVVTGRAVAPLPVQLELSAAWCKIGGTVVPFRTPADTMPSDLTLKKLGLTLEALETRTLPGEDAQRVFPVFRKNAKTDRTFPRRWADMKSKPLD